MTGKAAFVHPGEALLTEFMEPLGLTAYRLAKELDVPAPRRFQSSVKTGSAPSGLRDHFARKALVPRSLCPVFATAAGLC